MAAADVDCDGNSEAGKAVYIAELGDADVSLKLMITRIMRLNITTNVEH